METVALGRHDVFEKGEVHIVRPRRPDTRRITACAEGIRGRKGKCTGVEPLRHTAAARELWFGDAIGACYAHLEYAGLACIAGRNDAKRFAAGQHIDALQLPVPQDLTLPA